VVPHAGGKASSVPTIQAFTPGTPATVTGAMNPATSRVRAAGELPVPVGYGAAAVTGGTGYLVGGEDNGRRIVWQYGHTGKAGRGPGYLSDPDGVDLVPPDSLLVTHSATMRAAG
jgi:hypothetical protein